MGRKNVFPPLIIFLSLLFAPLPSGSDAVVPERDTVAVMLALPEFQHEAKIRVVGIYWQLHSHRSLWGGVASEEIKTVAWSVINSTEGITNELCAVALLLPRHDY